MNILGVIAEFNPFHNGHQYLLKTAKQQCQADYTIVVMSGDFTQRGEPAIYDKFIRARWALLCGADLVLELPVCAATASAGDFALGGVAQLMATGVVTHLGFGCESADMETLRHLASILSQEPQDYRALLKDGLKAGHSWPSARSLALEQYLKMQQDQTPARQEQTMVPQSKAATPPNQSAAAALPDAAVASPADFLRHPNNILALEYMMALEQSGASIKPLPVLRIHAGYHDMSLDRPVCSATALRNAIFSDRPFDSYVGHFPAEITTDARLINETVPPICAGDFSAQLSYALLNAPSLTSYMDMDQFLADRISNQLGSFTGYDSFVDSLCHRSYTRTRIQRALLHVMLDITREDRQILTDLCGCGYMRVLGFRKSAAPLLTAIKRHGTVPMLTRPAKAARVLSDTRALRLLSRDIHASDIYRLAFNIRAGQPSAHEFCRKLMVL